MAKTSQGKKSQKTQTAAKPKPRKLMVAGDPITVGGGGGGILARRRAAAKKGDSFIDFKRGAGHYLKKKSHQYQDDADVLLGIKISCAVSGPATGPNSTIRIAFSDSRVPDPNQRVSIVISGTPLGITFTDDWADSGPTRFYSSYMMLREVYVDEQLVAQSDTGDCTVIAYNLPVNRKSRR
jgi:hypothetical protein